MLKKVLLTIPFLFVLELILGESGRWFTVAEISIRKILFILSFISLCTVVLVAQRGWKFTRQDSLVAFFLLVNCIWGVVVPLFYHGSLSLSFADFGSVYVLILYFPLVILIRANLLSWESLKRMITGVVTLLACVHIAVWLGGALNPTWASLVPEVLMRLYNADGLYVGSMPDGFFRVMFVTSILLVPIFFVLWHSAVYGKHRIVALSMALLVSGALITSYARSFWLGIAVGVLVVVGLRYSKPLLHKVLLGALVLSRRILLRWLFVAVVIIGLASVLSNVDFDTGPMTVYERIASSADQADPSNKIKIEQWSYLIGAWESAPMLGQGFGAYPNDDIRSDSTPFSYELLFPALLMKLGLIGLVLFILPVLIIPFDAWLSKKSDNETRRLQYNFGGFFAFLISVQTNPMLFNAVGMSILLFYFVEFAVVCVERRPSTTQFRPFRTASA